MLQAALHRQPCRMTAVQDSMQIESAPKAQYQYHGVTIRMAKAEALFFEDG